MQQSYTHSVIAIRLNFGERLDRWSNTAYSGDMTFMEKAASKEILMINSDEKPQDE